MADVDVPKASPADEKADNQEAPSTSGESTGDVPEAAGPAAGVPESEGEPVDAPADVPAEATDTPNGEEEPPAAAEQAASESEQPAVTPDATETYVEPDAATSASPVDEPVPAAAPKQAAGSSAAATQPILAEGTYLFTWAKKAKLIVESAKKSRKAGANVALSKKSNILRQRWIVKYNPVTGYYTIMNEQSKKVLAVSSKKNGANVRQVKAKAGKSTQLWKVVKKGSNYIFIPKANRKLALTGVKSKKGYNLVVRKATKGKAQQFAMKQGGIVRNGVYAISLTKKTSKTLRVSGSSTADGALVKRGSYLGAQSQKFRITYRGNDLYTIQALHSGKFVGANGQAIVQAGNGNAAAQQWKVSWNKSGIAFKNAETGVRLNSKGKSSAVTGQQAANSAAQRWKLTRVSPKADGDIIAKALAKAKKQGSGTSYFMAVDLKHHRTLIFKRSGNGWKLAKNWVCSTGRSSSPTPRGTWTVGIKGYSFGHGYTCYYYTQFYGDYLFHSIPYKEGTFKVRDGRLGKSVSAGCVRLTLSHAKWIYNNIPGGTRVVTYK